jgi:hypothetical protein
MNKDQSTDFFRCLLFFVFLKLDACVDISGLSGRSEAPRRFFTVSESSRTQVIGKKCDLGPIISPVDGIFPCLFFLSFFIFFLSPVPRYGGLSPPRRGLYEVGDVPI